MGIQNGSLEIPVRAQTHTSALAGGTASHTINRRPPTEEATAARCLWRENGYPQHAKDSSFSLQGEEYVKLTDTFREKEWAEEGPEQAG